MIRILVADDHPVVRQGLIAILGTQPDFEVIGEAATGVEAVERVASLQPDVVLLDLEMPEMDGVEALQCLRESSPDVRVIVFTAFDTDERIMGAVRAGAQGYLLKGAPRDELFKAIRVTCEGGALLEPVVASKLLHHVGDEPRERPANPKTLTDHETMELLQLAHEEGHREAHLEEAETRRAVVTTAIGAILAIFMLAGGLVLWQGQAEEVAINRVYQRMSPAVANIQVTSAGVTGSGVVFDKNGSILTNYHVIRDAQSDEDITVQLPGLDQAPSKLIGYDVATDLAVLKVDIPSDRLTVARFGDSREVQVGDLAIAIGTPFGLSHTLTAGRISAIGRRLMSNDKYAPDIDGVLQTDAPINPGNSGGPLFNIEGEVIGINTRIVSPSGGSVGIGFAIPSNTALQVAQEIIARGYVRRPFLGVSGRPVDAKLAQDLDLPEGHGLLVQEAHPDSPAAKIGLRAGGELILATDSQVKQGADVLLSLDGEPIRNQSDLNRLVAQHAIGDKVALEILRNGRRLTVEVMLTERPLDGSWGQAARTSHGAESSLRGDVSQRSEQ